MSRHRGYGYRRNRRPTGNSAYDSGCAFGSGVAIALIFGGPIGWFLYFILYLCLKDKNEPEYFEESFEECEDSDYEYVKNGKVDREKFSRDFLPNGYFMD